MQRSPILLASALVVALASAAYAQRRPAPRPARPAAAAQPAPQPAPAASTGTTSWDAVAGPAPTTAAPNAPAAPPVATAPAPATAPATPAPPAAAAPAPAATPTPAAATPVPASSADAGAPAVAASTPAPRAATQPTTFDLPMVQRGIGAVVHYPIPEQLARNDVPVFVQVRTTAPIDHVSLFYRSRGAQRYREIRMTAAGQTVSLPNGYGAHIPCEDAFPPGVDYFVVAYDTSATPIGGAGNDTNPIALNIVPQRTVSIVPTLPGEAAPRNCGSLVVQPTPPTRTNATPGVPGTPGVRRPAPQPEPVIGTADLGEPCRTNNDCRRGLRCGAARQCVFIRPQQ